jgi:hypothetical protein
MGTLSYTIAYLACCDALPVKGSNLWFLLDMVLYFVEQLLI